MKLLLARHQEVSVTYVITFQLDLSFLTRDLKPLFGVNSSPLDELKMIVLLCCPSAFSVLASCEVKMLNNKQLLHNKQQLLLQSVMFDQTKIKNKMLTNYINK